MKTLRRAATEMALHVLAYDLMCVMNIMGVRTADRGHADRDRRSCNCLHRHRDARNVTTAHQGPS